MVYAELFKMIEGGNDFGVRSTLKGAALLRTTVCCIKNYYSFVNDVWRTTNICFYFLAKTEICTELECDNL